MGVAGVRALGKGAPRIGVPEAVAREAGAPEVGASDAGAPELGMADVGAPEVGLTTGCFEVGTVAHPVA
jgi:hypothetical protein